MNYKQLKNDIEESLNGEVIFSQLERTRIEQILRVAIGEPDNVDRDNAAYLAEEIREAE